MTKQELQTSEYDEFYSGYLSQLSDDTELVLGFEENSKLVLDFFKSVPHEKLEYRYDVGKWSIKEVFQHLIDTERVFQFRCFHIGRHDKTPLPGFEQNDYIEPSKANTKSIETLINEFKIVRKSFFALLKGFTDEDLSQVGIANGGNTSARAIAFINLGHCLHHINITKVRYL